jgi:uncharacterized sulfatase
VNEKTVIAGVDLLPSLIALGGLQLGDARLDGEDLSASMLGNAQQARSKPLFWIRPPDRPGDNRETWPDLSVRDGDFKLLLMEDGSGAQLYDLSNDPAETHNLVSQKPEVAQRLTKELLNWRKTLPVKPLSQM